MCIRDSLLSLTSSIHIVHRKSEPLKPDEQLQILKQQQDQFEERINQLVVNVTEVEKRYNKSDSTSEKVLIMEKAIVSERQQIYEIEKVLIPDFNLSRAACDQLTDEEKVHILDEIVASKEQVAELKALAETIPPNDELDHINADL